MHTNLTLKFTVAGNVKKIRLVPAKMFKKDFKVKSSVQMSGADRKIFRDMLRKKFNNLTLADVESILPKKEIGTITKITTHTGLDVLVYSIEKRAMFFAYENAYFPTVYLLWKLPKIGVVFTTNDLVVSKILKGADLMMPGIHYNPARNTDFGEHEIGVVNCLSNTAMVAVGLTTMPSTRMLGIKHGKAVVIYHYYGDRLCSMHNKSPLQIPKLGRFQNIQVPADLAEQLSGLPGGSTSSSSPTCCDSPTMKRLLEVDSDIFDKSNNVPGFSARKSLEEYCRTHGYEELLGDPNAPRPRPKTPVAEAWANVIKEQDDQIAGPSGIARKLALATIDETTTANNDEQDDQAAGPSGLQSKVKASDAFKATSCSSALLSSPGGSSPDADQGACAFFPTTPAVEKLSSNDELLLECFIRAVKYSKTLYLPMLTSTFYKNELLSMVPEGKTLDIRKTSYKKVSQFLRKMASENYCTIIERQKGVEVIEAINSEHPDIIQYKQASSVGKTSGDGCENDKPSIVETFIITAPVLPFFKPAGFKKGDALSALNVRKCITDYVKTKQLQSGNPKFVIVFRDEALSHFFKKETEVAWDKLMNTMLAAMTPKNVVTVGDKETVVKGKLEPITMKVETRSSNKKVTVVGNLELYGIKTTEFARECQLGVGASAIAVQSTKQKLGHMSIQGNQVNYVYKVLTEKYHIPKSHIKGLEFAPKKK